MMKKTTIAAFSSKASIRSISLPARSHPTTLRVEEELNKIKSWEASSSSKVETIGVGLLGLSDLYRCIEELLNLPLTQQLLAQHQHQKWFNDLLLESSLMYLDICGNTRDAILLMQETIQELQSGLRRIKVGDLSIESIVTTYNCSRRKMRKEIARSLASLKPLGNEIEAFPMLNLDHHLSAVVRVLNETSLITSSIFHSFLLFLSVPMLKPKPSRWSLVSKLVQKGVHELASKDQHENMNELEGVDLALNSLLMHNSSKDIEAPKIKSAQIKLDALDVSMKGLEKGLECLFRHLIQTRVFGLNIISQ